MSARKLDLRLPVVVAVAACFLFVTPVQAGQQPRGEPENVVKARAHFKQGRAYHQVGAHAQAIAEYEAAYALAPLTELLFNIAQAHRAMGDKEKARDFYQRYLRAEPEGRASDESRMQVALLTRQLEEEQEARLKTEEEARLKAEQETRFKAEETKRQEEARRQEEAKRQEEERRRLAMQRQEGVTGGDAEEARRRAAREEQQRKEAEAAARRALEAERERQRLDEEKRAEEQRLAEEQVEAIRKRTAARARGWKTAGAATVGVGLVATAFGAYFGLDAMAIDADLSAQSTDKRAWTPGERSKITDGENAERYAMISYGAGGVALVAGTVLYYVGHRIGSSFEDVSVMVTPAVLSSTVGLSMSVRY
ncbi:MAG: tetratricopeptide repeat protein [Pseudomonadota bacterium]